jgi:ABC-type phosphate transport system permease subunit
MPDPIDRIIENNEHMSEGGIIASIKYIQRDIAEINLKLDDKYVTKDQFEPVKNVVYGLVALILIAVVGALIALVINNPRP